MASDLLKALTDMKGRWMIGGSPHEKAPPAWRDALAKDRSPDLALFALAGQAMQFSLLSIPNGNLKTLPPLPRLGLPTPPPLARQQFRNLVRMNKLNESQVSAVIHLLAARGYVVHPTDYMPKNFDELPEVYTPWAAWQHSDLPGVENGGYDAIDEENWDDWMPAERRRMLAQLRKNHPATARKLLASRVPSLPAEERAKIFESLGHMITEEDQAMLQGFAKDRSGKVRQFVHQYLARVGAVEDSADDVAEFADFFSVSKRRLSSGYKIAANPLKTNAQRKRRGELAAKLSLHSFIKGLGLASETELLDGWKHADEDASEALVRMVAATGSEHAASTLASRITSLDGISAEAFQQLFDRLGISIRRILLPTVLKNDDASFSAAVLCARGLWGQIPIEQLTRPCGLKQLQKLASEDHSQNQVQTEILNQGLFSLGLLADQAAAKELLKLFTNTHLFASDPMLGLLKLNSFLPLGAPK